MNLPQEKKRILDLIVSLRKGSMDDKQFAATIDHNLDLIHQKTLWNAAKQIRELKEATMPPRGTMSIAIRIRDDEDKIDAIQHFTSLLEIKQSKGDLVFLVLDEIIRKVAKESEILKALLTNPKEEESKETKKCESSSCDNAGKWIESSGDGRLVRVCTLHRRLLTRQKRANNPY